MHLLISNVDPKYFLFFKWAVIFKIFRVKTFVIETFHRLHSESDQHKRFSVEKVIETDCRCNNILFSRKNACLFPATAKIMFFSWAAIRLLHLQYAI